MLNTEMVKKVFPRLLELAPHKSEAESRNLGKTFLANSVYLYLRRPERGLTQFGPTVVPLMTTFVLGRALQLPYKATITINSFHAMSVFDLFTPRGVLTSSRLGMPCDEETKYIVLI